MTKEHITEYQKYKVVTLPPDMQAWKNATYAIVNVKGKSEKYIAFIANNVENQLGVASGMTQALNKTSSKLILPI